MNLKPFKYVVAIEYNRRQLWYQCRTIIYISSGDWRLLKVGFIEFRSDFGEVKGCFYIKRSNYFSAPYHRFGLENPEFRPFALVRRSALPGFIASSCFQ